ncbi:DedA family protein [Euzebya rosea]|uniref:DedA family protein n=1 Tax=Euzebya rosea TaxID=2052804 RepID=UPI000D3E9A8A|nr:DedA family protein [Euzebya rosea]
MELLHPDHLVMTFGLIGVIAVVFIESGLLVGFFLPGDSLLFTAGLLAAGGVLDLPVLLVGVCLAAVLGDQTGYWLGSRLGMPLLRRERWWSRPAHVERARTFFEERGGRAVLLARFVPIVRTFVPFVAGAVAMPYRAFVGWNVAGGLLWGGGVTTAGYLLGEAIPDIDRYLLPIIGVIVLASVVPVLLELRTGSRHPAVCPATPSTPVVPLDAAPADEHVR